MSDAVTDIVERSEQALDGITPGKWEINREGWACISSGPDSVIHAFYDSECPACDETITDTAVVAISMEDAEFIAAAPQLVRELLAEVKRLRGEVASCDMKCGEPYDFAWCETHDTTFPLGDKCKFDGREPWEVYADEAYEQRQLKVRAEIERDALRAQVERVRKVHNSDGQVEYCTSCQEAAPCVTIRALDGDS